MQSCPRGHPRPRRRRPAVRTSSRRAGCARRAERRGKAHTLPERTLTSDAARGTSAILASPRPQ
eukprot:scaffold3878_cov363-Prasinococcus_capsulatus_cf.AAC.12